MPNLASITPQQVRRALLLRDEIALLDLRHERDFATGHPLFAANMAADRIVLEAEHRLPCKDVALVVYDAGEGLVASARETFASLGYTNVRELDGGLVRAARIVPWITVETPAHVSVYQLLHAHRVVCERAGLVALEEALS